MIRGSSHFQTVLTVLAVTYLLHVNAATDNSQVINEINKLEKFAKTLQTPPELVDTLLKQLETHCQKDNRTIDRTYLNNAGKCVEKHLNLSMLADEMREAVPEGKMDVVFRDICLKWPNLKDCVKDFLEILDDCWQKGNKIDLFIDKAVKFFCGDDNGGERIALFFAEGGLECVQEHVKDVKECIEAKQEIEISEDKLNPDELNNLDFSKIPIPDKDEICEKIQEMHQCATVGFQKCKDLTTQNLVTSMLKEVGKDLECRIKETKMPLTTTTGGGYRAVMGVQSIILFVTVGLLF